MTRGWTRQLWREKCLFDGVSSGDPVTARYGRETPRQLLENHLPLIHIQGVIGRMAAVRRSLPREKIIPLPPLSAEVATDQLDGRVRLTPEP